MIVKDLSLDKATVAVNNFKRTRLIGHKDRGRMMVWSTNSNKKTRVSI